MGPPIRSRPRRGGSAEFANPDGVDVLLEGNSLATAKGPDMDHLHRGLPDRASARRVIFAWINRYNQLRLHSSLRYLPPIEWENQYRQSQANQAA